MKMKIGVSACVVGQPVRFDGGHKQFRFLTDRLGAFADYVPVCPEMAAGLGSPRPTIRQVQLDGRIELRGSANAELVVTDVVDAAAARLAQGLEGLCGFVFCAKSPTCGMERVKIYRPDGNVEAHDGVGVFAAKVMAQYPQLPCEETGRLNDPLIRESFLNRVFAMQRFQVEVLGQLSAKALVDFHASYKFLILAHSPELYRELGKLVADLKAEPLAQRAHQYICLFNQALRKAPTRKKHTNALMHIQGFFKSVLSAADKQALTDMILRYQQGLLPLSAPLEMLKHHQRHIADPYLALQRYFEPYPEVLHEPTPL